MIKFKQFITEASYIPKGIKDHLVSMGYKYLGSGKDQQAYLEPGTGNVLKIFGTDRSNRLSEDQKMLKFWAEYCNKHHDNPFLPRFSGWEEFDYQGYKYLRIHMEKLQKLPPKLAVTLEDIANFATYPQPSLKVKYWHDIDFMIEHGEIPADIKDLVNKDGPEELRKLVMLLGGGKLGWFWNTMQELSDIGRAHNWGIDFHKGNFMHRNDGVPIIVDPWAV